MCLYDCVCQLKGISDDSYRNYFVERKDEEAVEHLFYLTSGLKSQIIGEDQILTQVKDALNLGHGRISRWTEFWRCCSVWRSQQERRSRQRCLFPMEILR